ncbi:hypothetical protein NKG99_32150 [Mesorhizobium sp. M1409]|uniref:hypothetical protein n=1 Tax=unclassified Mesorhizobium TaxID=325217 RepID=UPI0033397FC0
MHLALGEAVDLTFDRARAPKRGDCRPDSLGLLQGRPGQLTIRGIGDPFAGERPPTPPPNSRWRPPIASGLCMAPERRPTSLDEQTERFLHYVQENAPELSIAALLEACIVVASYHCRKTAGEFARR